MLWLVLCLCLVSVNSQGPPPSQVEFTLLILGNPYSCDESTDWCDLSGAQAYWYNDSAVCVGGKIDLKQTIEPCTMLSIVVNKESNGKSEAVATLEICDVCDEIGNLDSNYYKFLKFFLLPEKCPVEAGQYEIMDLTIDSDELPLNGANSGQYKIFLNFYKLDGNCNCKGDKTYLSCVQFDCAIEPI